jgi:hypothetical protein
VGTVSLHGQVTDPDSKESDSSAVECHDIFWDLLTLWVTYCHHTIKMSSLHV